MMYSDKCVVAIKSGGKVLRESKDLVKLPYGSEFSVLVKNLNSRRMKFTLQIDGQDVLDGTSIIVNANSETEIKRFIRNGNMDEGNAFKFIERTAQIENGPRGIKMEDGIVRVEFWFEQAPPTVTRTVHYDEYRSYPIWWNGSPYYGTSSIARDVNSVYLKSINNVASNTISSTESYSAEPTNVANAANITTNEVGITVPGSKVEQKFTTVYGFNSESTSNVVILRMIGAVGDKEIVKAVTVKSKAKCSTCGRLNKSHAKFCQDCGTSLDLL